MATEPPRAFTTSRRAGFALIALGTLLLVLGLATLTPARAGAPEPGAAAAQGLSDRLAAFARADGQPVGRPVVRRLNQETAGSLDLGNGASVAIGGLSLRDGTILLSDQAIETARRSAARGLHRTVPFQLVKLILHEQLHQVTWRGRREWYPVGSRERDHDEGLTEALAWDIARRWCEATGVRCTGTRAVVSAYRGHVERMRATAIAMSGAAHATDPAARDWMRAYLMADDTGRAALRGR